MRGSNPPGRTPALRGRRSGSSWTVPLEAREEIHNAGARPMRRVLMTGAAGGIGRRLRLLLRGLYPELRLSDRAAIGGLAAGESFVAADLADLAAVEQAVAGVEGIIHLG